MNPDNLKEISRDRFIKRAQEYLKAIIDSKETASPATPLALETLDEETSLLQRLINQLTENYTFLLKERSESNDRLNKFVDIIASISSLKFDKRVEVSDRLDIIDGIACGLNILSEEVQHSTVSRNYLNSVIESIPDLFFIVNRNGLITSYNSVMQNTLGYAKADVVSLNLVELFPDVNFSQMVSHKREAVPFENVDALIYKQNKKPVRGLLTAFPLFERDKEISGIICLFKVMNEKLLTERALKKTEEKYQKLYQMMHDGFMVTDLNGNILEVNPFLLKMLGYEIDEIYDMNISALQTAKSMITRKQQMEPLFRNSFTELYECELISKSGIVISVEQITYLIKSEKDEPAGFWSIIRDITYRKGIEVKLKESQERLNKAQEIAHLGHWDWNIETGSLSWSDEIYRIFGVEPQSFPATYEAFLETIHPDDRGKVMEAVGNAVAKGAQYRVEHRIVVPDQSVKFVYEQGEVYYDENKKAIRMIGTVHDITERKNVEEKLVQRQKEIEELNSNLNKQVHEEVVKSRQKDLLLIQQSKMAALGEMISSIAHQWRQPLNALQLMVTNLRLDAMEGLISEKGIELFSEKSSIYIHKMSSTIDDFRNFYKPDKNRELFNVNEVVKNSIQLSEYTMAHNNIHIRFIEKDNHNVTGYPGEFSQVILNLLNNSRDQIIAHKSQKREIEVIIDSAENNSVVTIADTGGGIAENIIGKIFDIYFTTKEGDQGTGIGLYMSKMIIEEHMKGRIFAENVESGARFKIVVPLFLFTEDKR